jgi:hypothetical protein
VALLLGVKQTSLFHNLRCALALATVEAKADLSEAERQVKL